ncbi:MAG: ATP-dependent protease ATPase subunit HslU [Myxococcales bacterium]|nr:ATP-dependent protease ATPase subunit HslU [Myxococcales bacterium]USN51963.1 MAG: ATP-dependent protease ATPase subunit HslU [Myxococcales bacterium]
MEKNFTPREVVSELDRYIVGQKQAKKAVAIALRNRWRRQRVDKKLRDEISPKNIIMMGPTGCGKTEIARRLAKLANAPFIKVEATKFTEVGYVGRDVDSMVRDLVECSVKMCKENAMKGVASKAAQRAQERILDILLPAPQSPKTMPFDLREVEQPTEPPADKQHDETREKMRAMLKEGKLDNKEVNIEVSQASNGPVMHMFGQTGMEDMANQIQEALQGAMGRGRKKKKKMTVPEALEVLQSEEAARLIDMEQVQRDAVEIAEQNGIIFIDEIDKVAKADGGKGPDVSREGVQRDILPIVEGSTVSTKYGFVKTDHILFIAAGAFHISKPSDLIPELQGRFPIRVELDSLNQEDFIRILTEPENSLVKQYSALLKTEDVDLKFESSGIKSIAQVAYNVNSSQENIGARRLHTVMEKLLEEESFSSPDTPNTQVVIDEKLVLERLSPILKDEDLSKYIL